MRPIMERIFTITCNLLAETSLYIGDLPGRGKTLRATKETFRTGGKGVNAAKAFHALGGEAYALIFPAGETGERCLKYLKKEGFAKILCVRTSGQTREGFVMKTQDGAETTVLGADRPLALSTFRKGLELVLKNAREKDCIALCGSVPGWSNSFGKAFMHAAKERNLKTVIDTYGSPLKFFASEPETWMLKINSYEFASLFGKSRDSISDFKEFFRSNARKVRAQNIIVTDGANAVESLICGELMSILPPKIKTIVSATGSGDVFTASAARFFSCTKPKLALKAAAIAASESAKSVQIADFSKVQLAKIFAAARAAM